MKKRFSCICMALLMMLSAFSMAGCGDKNNPDSSEKNNTSAGGVTTGDLSFYDNIPAELLDTTVKFATWIDHKQNEAADVLSSFYDVTGIKAELVVVPQDEYITKLTALIAANQAPDMIVDNFIFPQTLSVAQPLNDYIDVNDEFWDQEFVRNSTINGKTYFLNAKNTAWDMGQAYTLWNKTIFDDNGIKTPAEYVAEDNWNWDTAKKVIKEVSAIGDDIKGACFDADAFTAAYGGNYALYDSDKQQFVNNMNNPAIVEAYTYFKNLKITGQADLTHSGSGSFVDGNVGLVFTGGWCIRKSGGLASMDTDDVGVTFMPKKNASDESYPTNPGWRAYGICKGSKNPQAAAYFMRYFLDINNYDKSEIFISDEAEEIYYKTVAATKEGTLSPAGGLYRLVYPDDVYVNYDMLWLPVEQLTTAIAKVKGIYDNCIAEGNKIIKSVAEG